MSMTSRSRSSAPWSLSFDILVGRCPTLHNTPDWAQLCNEVCDPRERGCYWLYHSGHHCATNTLRRHLHIPPPPAGPSWTCRPCRLLHPGLVTSALCLLTLGCKWLGLVPFCLLRSSRTLSLSPNKCTVVPSSMSPQTTVKWQHAASVFARFQAWGLALSQ